MVDFLFAIIKHFSLALSQSRRFSMGVGHFKRKFQGEEISPTNVCWYQKTRVITLSCGIKISAVCSFVSSQSSSTPVTDEWTERENYDPQDRASIAALRGKN